MIRLSVNVNKVATVRNSRGGRCAVGDRSGARRASMPARRASPSIRAPTQRHITTADVREIAEELAPLEGRVEFNIEGDPRPISSSSCSR